VLLSKTAGARKPVARLAQGLNRQAACSQYPAQTAPMEDFFFQELDQVRRIR